MRACGLGVALLLAGCAAVGGWIKPDEANVDWTKPGADAATTASEYQDCRRLAEGAVKTDADIDQDIQATRPNDWQRSGIVRAGTQAMQEHTINRAAAIVGACMRAKGFVARP
ncbi:MAG: hypothetical protein ACHQC9_00570 [Alphaproteobacteria bacterium]